LTLAKFFSKKSDFFSATASERRQKKEPAHAQLLPMPPAAPFGRLSYNKCTSLADPTASQTWAKGADLEKNYTRRTIKAAQ